MPTTRDHARGHMPCQRQRTTRLPTCLGRMTGLTLAGWTGPGLGWREAAGRHCGDQVAQAAERRAPLVGRCRSETVACGSARRTERPRPLERTRSLHSTDCSTLALAPPAPLDVPAALCHLSDRSRRGVQSASAWLSYFPPPPLIAHAMTEPFSMAFAACRHLPACIACCHATPLHGNGHGSLSSLTASHHHPSITQQPYLHAARPQPPRQPLRATSMSHSSGGSGGPRHAQPPAATDGTAGWRATLPRPSRTEPRRSTSSHQGPRVGQV